MVAQQTSSGRLQSTLGIVILALGILVFLPKFTVVTPHLEESVQELGLDVYNALPAISLGVLHAGQALAFDPPSFFAGALRILVSFWPLLLVTIGTVLLRNAFGNWLRTPGVSDGSAAGEGRS